MDGIQALRTVTLTACTAGTVASCDMPNGGRFPQGGVASPDDAPEAAEVVPAQGLQLILDTEKPEYVVGEPVYATVVLENTGEQTERVLHDLRPEGEAVRIFVTGPDDGEVLFRPLGIGDQDQDAWTDLAAGNRIGTTAPIFFGANGWTFTTSGQYQLAAEYAWGGQDLPVRQLRSDVATIEIAPGGDAGDLLTRGDSASLEAGKLLTWQSGDHLEQGRALLRGLLDQPTGSVLRSHAAFVLGRSYSEPFMDYGIGEVRPADCAEATSLLDRVSVTDLGTQSQALMEIARARCAARTSDRAEALDHLARAQAVVEGRAELQELEERIREYTANLNRIQG